MPYEMYKNGDKTCVRNKVTGESKGCSDSHAKAVAHMRALYAAEGGDKMGKKELDEAVTMAVKEFNTQNPDDQITKEQEEMALKQEYVPFGVTSFAQLAEARKAMEIQEGVLNLTGDFVSLISNVFYSPEVTDKGAAVMALAKEYNDLLPPVSTGEQDAEEAEGVESKEESEEEADDDPAAEKAVWDTAYVNNLPDSAFLYVEPGEKDGEGKTKPRSKRHFPYKDAGGKVDLPHLRNAIARIPQSNAPGLSSEKKASLQNRARRMLESKKELNLIERVWDAIKERLSPSQVLQTPPDQGFMLQKDSSGNYRWFARYTNKYRDVDNPPQILSEKSHLRFVDRLDKGLAPMPVLQLWHVKEWTIGVADWVAYDDTGFMVASGMVTPEAIPVAEEVKEWDDLQCSHGMPISTIQYDPDDPSVIVAYETREISLLPGYAAANKLTGAILKEEDMAIPEHKKNALIARGVAPELLAGLEKANQKDAALAGEKGIESKERKEQETPQEPPAEEAAAVVDEAPAQDNESGEAPQSADESAEEPHFVTAKEVEDALVAVTSVLSKQIETLAQSVNALQSNIKELKESDDARFADVARHSTQASLLAAISEQRATGSKSAQLKPDAKLAESKPKEAAASDIPEVTPIPLINKWIAGGK